jgi:hypothetical protein
MIPAAPRMLEPARSIPSNRQIQVEAKALTAIGIKEIDI